MFTLSYTSIKLKLKLPLPVSSEFELVYKSLV